MASHVAPSAAVADADRDGAAVLIAVTDEAAPRVLLTEKAGHLRTHGGEVALPGGRVEPQDGSLLHTALREAHEETGLQPDALEVLGSLRPAVSKHGLLVTPWVALMPANVALVPDPGEIASLFLWPLSELLADRRLRTDRISRTGRTLLVPSWEWDGYVIWGLTALLLADFANAALGAAIDIGETA